MTETSRLPATLISLRNVGLRYWHRRGFLRRKEFWGLTDVTLDVRRGEALGVVGRNGAGKTTLMQLMAGIICPDRGELINHGCQAALLQLRIGFVPYLTGRENAILSGMMLGFTKRQIEDKMDEIIEFSELGEFIEQPVRTYSSGMAARLGFSVAIYMDPDVLLIDEILGVGDAAFRDKSVAAMQEKLDAERTVVMVSHAAPRIRQFCQRVVWIEDGATKAEGPTEEVLGAYEEFLKGLRKNAALPGR